MKKDFDVSDARKILKRALTPEHGEILRQLSLVEKKIKICCAHKQTGCFFEVVTEFKQPEQNNAVALLVAGELKRRGFGVRIRHNTIKICWQEENEKKREA